MATTFKAGDREWAVKLNVGKAMAIKAALGVDLMSVKDLFGELQKLSEDMHKFIEAIWLMVSDNVTDSDKPAVRKAFLDSLDGDALDGARQAFEGAVVLFTPALQRGQLKAVLEKSEIVAAKMETRTRAMLTDEAIDRQLDLLTSRPTSGNAGPGSAPASSESTPPNPAP